MEASASDEKKNYLFLLALWQQVHCRGLDEKKAFSAGLQRTAEVMPAI